MKMIVKCVVKTYFYVVLYLRNFGVQGENQSSWVKYDVDQMSWTGISQCSLRTTNPNQMSWHVEGRRIDEFSHRHNELVVNDNVNDDLITTLYIYNFTQHHVKDYTCLYVDNLNENFFSQWIYSPPVIMLNSNALASVGEIVNVSCTTYSGGEIYWIFSNVVDNLVVNVISNEINSTSIIHFNALDTTNYAIIKCCVRKSQNQRTPIPCSSTYINTYTVPVLEFKTSCNDLICNFTCMLQGYPDVEISDISWNVCDSSDNCQLMQSTATYFDDHISKTVTELKNVLVNLSNSYWCHAFNLMGNVSHKFNVDSGYVSPKIASFVVSSDYYFLEITCHVKAYPSPFQYIWRKQPIFDFSFGWENVTEDDHYSILISNTSSEGIFTILRINNYNQSEDEANFSCCVISGIGQACAQTVASYYSDVNVSVSNANPNDGERVTFRCSSFGLPPPQLEISVVAEFSVEYVLEWNCNTNSTEAIVHYFADWFTNPSVNIKCYTFNEDFSTGSDSELRFIRINYTPSVSPVHKCTAEDFKGNDSVYCQLSCLTQGSKSDLLLDWRWKYSIPLVNDSVNIYEQISYWILSPYRTLLSLNLSDYNAGVYSCWFLYRLSNGTAFEIQYDFNIDSSQEGVKLHDACETSQECLALDATCANCICQCLDPYIYLAENSSYSPACLKGAGQFEPCNIDEQCSDAGDNFYCSNHDICDCNGTYMDIPDADMYLCLQPAEIGDLCSYEQECILNDNSSRCINGSCRCDDYYIFNGTLDKCISDWTNTTEPINYDTYNLSMGAIIGIIIGVTAVIIMIICIVGLVIGRRRGLV